MPNLQLEVTGTGATGSKPANMHIWAFRKRYTFAILLQKDNLKQWLVVNFFLSFSLSFFPTELLWFAILSQVNFQQLSPGQILNGPLKHQ